eukprot:CAMPEP_0169221002 /NCGR_PEP_ID=MMETSP1016-20121227/20816_1 /TAXON_ID=342587 /ORGANISM="Karlodinium micrum, Strain CCMP2283" /LENGTH=371 /DNA_ID=CAMNT_0009299181 /DNA_START=88 /DNA_END=1203 /DNA_ORIENTATION=-
MSTCTARRVQSTPRNWELENSVLQLTGAMNDAELGMANLKQAMRDAPLLKEVAHELRHHPESRAEVIKLLANPSFQQQMKALIQANGAVADFLTPEFYAKGQEIEDTDSPKALSSLLLALNPVSTRAMPGRTSVRMDAMSDLKAQAKALNPALGYFDPLSLASGEFWGQSNEATIGWLRHAEMKHGRVAMAGFVGYCIHENGIHWPWPLTNSLPDYSSFEGLSAPAVWDAIPSASKLQIIIVIGFFEFWSENRYILESEGQKHYMKGGKPGFFPSFKEIPHPVPFNLFDPFGFTKKLSEEQKARKLNIEVNNGRLAMIGLMSLVSEAKVPGAVPALAGMIKKYDGQPMAPFAENDVGLQFVDDMLKVNLGF